MSDADSDGIEVGDAESCPCESGRTYRDCCKSGLGQLIRLPNGSIVDRRPIPEQALDVLDTAHSNFSDVFGRKPQKGDRIFLAAHLDARSETIQVMLKALDDDVGRPEFVYAYRETGLLPTETTYPLMSERDREDWNDAIDEFEALIDEGIDPFTGCKAEVRGLFDHLGQFCQDCAIHFGSYVDRYRKDRKLDIHEFSQILVLSRSQKLLLLLQNKLGAQPTSDALVLIRSLLECYLVHEYLKAGRIAGLYFLARASKKGDGLFDYKIKQKGRTDDRIVVFNETGEKLPSYVSFYTMAATSTHNSDTIIFDRIYARLSDEVHFSFKNWRDYWQGTDVIRTSTEGNAPEVSGVFLLAVAMLADSVAGSEVHTKTVRRDARYLFRRTRQAFGFLMSNLDLPPSDVFFDEDLLRAIGKRLAMPT